MGSTTGQYHNKYPVTRDLPNSNGRTRLSALSLLYIASKRRRTEGIGNGPVGADCPITNDAVLPFVKILKCVQKGFKRIRTVILVGAALDTNDVISSLEGTVPYMFSQPGATIGGELAVQASSRQPRERFLQASIEILGVVVAVFGFSFGLNLGPLQGFDFDHCQQITWPSASRLPVIARRTRISCIAVGRRSEKPVIDSVRSWSSLPAYASRHITDVCRPPFTLFPHKA